MEIILKDIRMEEKNNISDQDVWTILEEEGLTQYLGITKDEFYFLAELNQKNLSECMTRLTTLTKKDLRLMLN